MSAPYTVKEFGHRYQPGTYPNAEYGRCGFQHPLWNGQYCGAGPDHDWHQFNCGCCLDSGVWWTDYNHPMACRGCEVGDEMKEFLII